MQEEGSARRGSGGSAKRGFVGARQESGPQGTSVVKARGGVSLAAVRMKTSLICLPGA